MKRFGWLVAGISFCSFVPLANGMFPMRKYAPVDRLIVNGEAYLRENPNDAHGYHTFGRTHYLAFASKSKSVCEKSV